MRTELSWLQVGILRPVGCEAVIPTHRMGDCRRSSATVDGMAGRCEAEWELIGEAE